MTFLKKEKIIKVFILTILILLIAGSRLVEHPYNFTPIASAFLFFGAYFNRKYLLIPIFSLIISDFFIGFYELELMITVYGSFVIIGFLGFYLKKKRDVYAYVGLPILSGIIFFLITNGAVWMFSSWYPKTLAGLLSCYYMAIPFFKFTLLGNLFYSSIFFSAYEYILVRNREEIKKIKTVDVI
jgi:hypothetical protein